LQSFANNKEANKIASLPQSFSRDCKKKIPPILPFKGRINNSLYLLKGGDSSFQLPFVNKEDKQVPSLLERRVRVDF